MWLLDIIANPDRIYERIIIPENDVVDTVEIDSVACDTVYVDSVFSVDIPGAGQQLADVAPLPPKFLGLEGSEILWTVLVVLVALSLCFYFVRMYRRQHHE
ncbi:MAG: hypothetical protein IJ159_03910 [Prevotella sp.]|nr:hypothetical protein [Prevotella sp.]